MDYHRTLALTLMTPMTLMIRVTLETDCHVFLAAGDSTPTLLTESEVATIRLWNRYV